MCLEIYDCNIRILRDLTAEITCPKCDTKIKVTEFCFRYLIEEWNIAVETQYFDENPKGIYTCKGDELGDIMEGVKQSLRDAELVNGAAEEVIKNFEDDEDDDFPGGEAA